MRKKLNSNTLKKKLKTTNRRMKMIRVNPGKSVLKSAQVQCSMEPLIVLSLWDMPRPCICFIVSVHHSPSFFQSVPTVSYIFTSSSKAIALVCNMDPIIPLQRQLFDLRDAEHIYHLMIIQVSDKTFNKNSLNREFIWILLVSSAE